MTRARLLCPHARDGGAGAGEGKINKNIKANKTFFCIKIGNPGGDGEPALHLRHGGRGALLCQVVQGEPALSLDVSIHKSYRRMAMNFSVTSPGTGSRGSQPSTCRASR